MHPNCYSVIRQPPKLIFSQVPLSMKCWIREVSLYVNACGHLTVLQWNLQIKDTLGPLSLSFVRRLSSLGGSKCIRTIGKTYFGTSSLVLCREVYGTVSLLGRVHYQRFHCMHYRVNFLNHYSLYCVLACML